MVPGSYRVRGALIAIVILAAALRFYPIWFGLPYPYARPDEEVAVGLALGMQGGDLNPRFFHWPSLTLYALASLFAAASVASRSLSLDFPPEGYLLLARGFVAACGTLTTILLFRLTQRAADRVAALIAALLLSVALLHVRESHFAMTDVLMTLLLMASLLLLLRALDESRVETLRRRALANAALAGLLGGLATSTKYSAAAIVPTMFAAQLAWLRTTRANPWQLMAWAPTASFAVAFVVGFVAATPYAVLDPEMFVTDVRSVFTHLSGGHGLDVGRGWTYHLRRSLPYGAGIPTSIMAIAGLAAFARLGWHAVVLATAALAFYVSVGSGTTVFFRYVLPLVPIVCLVAALGVRDLGQWLARRSGASPALTVGLLTAAVAVPSLAQCVRFDRVLAETDTRVLAAAWLMPRLQADHSLHDAGGTYARMDLRRVRFHEWGFDPGSGSFGPIDGGRPEAPRQPPGVTPDWLVLYESPLQLYASAPPALVKLAADSYGLEFTVHATKGDAGSAVYDVHDAFFVPMAGFSSIERPGPTIRIFRRRHDIPTSP